VSTLDAFMQPQLVKPNQHDSRIYVQEKCSDCGATLGANSPKYDLRIKGDVKPYCRDCARKRLPKPKPEESEEQETGCINAHTVFRRSRNW